MDTQWSEYAQDIASRWVGALNSGALDALDDIVAEDVVDHSGFSRIHGRGRDGIKRLVTELRRVMPDWFSSIDEVILRGDDRVTIRHTGGGTPPAPFIGRADPSPPENPVRKVRLQLVSTIRVSNGKIVEHWARSDP